MQKAPTRGKRRRSVKEEKSVGVAVEEEQSVEAILGSGDWIALICCRASLSSSLLIPCLMRTCLPSQAEYHAFLLTPVSILYNKAQIL